MLSLDITALGASQEELELARRRVANGAEFFNTHLPGWQKRIIEAGDLLDMHTADHDAAAVAAYEKVGPDGKRMFSHGDVCRAFGPLGFDPIYMGTMRDDYVRPEVLGYFWRLAALSVAALPKQALPQARPHRHRLAMFGILAALGLVATQTASPAAERQWPIPTRSTITRSDGMIMGTCESKYELQKGLEGKSFWVWREDKCTAKAHNALDLSYPLEDLPALKAWETRKRGFLGLF